ncbi:uncharacterized protein LOC113362060 [Papaver somniferum]|uniref:uncharacterized protein LOC113362060 n=1 Tax=Papaver somniferum TaxID=3469 RepID=UPI000E6FD6CF|nr:uncharacterized protein LOC113362060 [Papaver somniferum]
MCTMKRLIYCYNPIFAFNLFSNIIASFFSSISPKSQTIIFSSLTKSNILFLNSSEKSITHQCRGYFLFYFHSPLLLSFEIQRQQKEESERLLYQECGNWTNEVQIFLPVLCFNKVLCDWCWSTGKGSTKQKGRKRLVITGFFVTWGTVNVAKSFEYLGNWKEESLIQVLL